MKKIICKIPSNLFEIFLVELNGYGFEIINRKNDEVFFSIYAQDEDYDQVRDMVDEIFQDLSAGGVESVEDIKEENWEEKWKENFKPIRIGNFIIIPEWEVYDSNDYIPIKIKVAMAFGTGLHPTTQLMLRFIPKYIDKEDTVVDVGTGTGILAIASAKIGAKVDAFDIDPRAVDECKINAWENQVNINCSVRDITDDLNIYDVVLSNLQIDLFEKYFDILAKKFRKYWIVSGIFQEKEKDRLMDMAMKNDLQVVDTKSMSEEGRAEYVWYGFVLKHK